MAFLEVMAADYFPTRSASGLIAAMINHIRKKLMRAAGANEKRPAVTSTVGAFSCQRFD